MGNEIEETSKPRSNAGNGVGDKDEGWARELIARVAFASLLEQRRARRWGIFFKALAFVYLFGLLLVFALPSEWGLKSVIGAGHTAVVSVEGLISSTTAASAENIIESLQNAFEDEQTTGIVLEINSPGGSPVQAGQVYDEIRRLRSAHPNIPLYAVASDVCASGGYYIAAAADKIYADKASIIGSIGVRVDSFGFVDAMEKLGIERRLYTAGENKASLDPFLPSDPSDIAHLRGMLADIHRQFIDAVKQGRGGRLGNDPQLFTGLFWTGDRSLELGLIDGLGSTRYVAEEIIGAEKVVDFTSRSRMLDRVLRRVEASIGQVLRELFGSGRAMLR